MPAGSGRSIFVLPWLGRTLIGTTDNDYEGGLDHVPPSHDDIEYLLEATNSFFSSDLSDADLTGAYAGVLALVADGGVPEQRWLLTVGTALAAGLLVHQLRDRIDRL